MNFDIEYKEVERPIERVKFSSAYGTAYGTSCELYTLSNAVGLKIANDVHVEFESQSAIELGEMLIKLGKQEMGRKVE